MLKGGDNISDTGIDLLLSLPQEVIPTLTPEQIGQFVELGTNSNITSSRQNPYGSEPPSSRQISYGSRPHSSRPNIYNPYANAQRQPAYTPIINSSPSRPNRSRNHPSSPRSFYYGLSNNNNNNNNNIGISRRRRIQQEESQHGEPLETPTGFREDSPSADEIDENTGRRIQGRKWQGDVLMRHPRHGNKFKEEAPAFLNIWDLLFELKKKAKKEKQEEEEEDEEKKEPAEEDANKKETAEEEATTFGNNNNDNEEEDANTVGGIVKHTAV